MKKIILLFTVSAGMISMMLSSYSGGPAFGSENHTGAKGSNTNCGGTACHGTGTSTSVSITVDSGVSTTPTTYYVPNKVYTVKLHGTSTTSFSKYGFEYAVVSGSGMSQVQASACSTFPTGVTADLLSGISFVEQSHTLTSATPGVYDVSFQWTAPATNVGNITMYCTINAVNGMYGADPADISGNASIILKPLASLGVNKAIADIDVKVYPNPISDNVNVVFSNTPPGTYTIQVSNILGGIVVNETIDINSISQNISLMSNSWCPGLYQLVIKNDESRKVLSVIK